MTRYYTRDGEDGYTSLLGVERVPKYAPRPEAYGTVDELSSALGLARATARDARSREILMNVQRHLYQAMTELAATPEAATRFPQTAPDDVAELERLTDELGDKIELPNDFVIPGDTLASAALDLARTVARRAERLVARIGDQSVHSTSMVAEHRPQYAWRAHSLLSDGSNTNLSEARRYLQRPLWMLPEPALLPADGAYPLHQGCRLRLLEGPERLETGWWDEDGMSRDYYTAINPAGMRLWVFRNRKQSPAWYLHGYFG